MGRGGSFDSGILVPLKTPQPETIGSVVLEEEVAVCAGVAVDIHNVAKVWASKPGAPCERRLRKETHSDAASSGARFLQSEVCPLGITDCPGEVSTGFGQKTYPRTGRAASRVHGRVLSEDGHYDRAGTGVHVDIGLQSVEGRW